IKLLDAGVVVELLIGGIEPDRIGAVTYAAPHLIDSEVTNAFRNLVIRELLTPDEGGAAMAGFIRLHLTRYSAAPLRARMWELRDNLSAYDATYVALAET